MKKLKLSGIINYTGLYPSDIYSQRSRWNILLLLVAIAIGAGSLWYTHQLVSRLSIEERKKVELWAEATRILASSSENSHLEFLLKVIETNNWPMTEGDAHFSGVKTFGLNRQTVQNFALCTVKDGKMDFVSWIKVKLE